MSKETPVKGFMRRKPGALFLKTVPVKPTTRKPRAKSQKPGVMSGFWKETKRALKRPSW